MGEAFDCAHSARGTQTKQTMRSWEVVIVPGLRAPAVLTDQRRLFRYLPQT